MKNLSYHHHNYITHCGEIEKQFKQGGFLEYHRKVRASKLKYHEKLKKYFRRAHFGV